MPNEKHEFSTGWRAAQKGRPASCTTGRASGLHIKAVWGLHSKLGCGKGRAGGLHFSAARPALFRSPPDRLFVQPAGSPFCLLCSRPARRKFTFFIWKHGSPARLALQLVLSDNCLPALKPLQHLWRMYDYLVLAT